MNLIAVDTSSQNVSFAIYQKNGFAAVFNRRMRFGSSKLIVLLEKYLKKICLDIRKIDALVIGSGPGSFTGLRVSYSLIKGFSIALEKPVIAIESFYSIAYPFRKKYKKIAVIADARKNLIYAVSYMTENGRLRKAHKEVLADLKDYIAARKDHFFITPDEHIRKDACALVPGLAIHKQPQFPNAKYLLELAIERYNKLEFTPIEKLEPLYVHPKTCQIRKSS